MICDVCHHPIYWADRVCRSPTGRLYHFDCNATRTTMRTGLVQALYGDPPSDQPSPAAAPAAPVKSEDLQTTNTPGDNPAVRNKETTMPSPSVTNVSLDNYLQGKLTEAEKDYLIGKANAALTTPVKSEAAKLIDSHMDLCQRARDIMVGKNHDYRGGSGDPFANFRGSVSLGIHPGIGILLRMQDKMMRVKTFIEKGQLKVKGEGLDDAILDIINYAVLLRGLLGGLPSEARSVSGGVVGPALEAEK